MGILNDELRKKRKSWGGLVLIVVLLPLLAYPLLRTREINHPLSAQLQLDLCARLPPPPATLPQPLHRVGQNANGNISCEYRDQSNAMVLSVFLTTTRTASLAGPQKTSAIFETWMKEVKVSGATEVRDHIGPWAVANSYRMGSSQQMLVEDHGVMLSMNSPILSAADMAAYARESAVALRTATP